MRSVHATASIQLQETVTGRIAAKTLDNELWQTDGNPAYDLAKRLIDEINKRQSKTAEQ